MLRVRAGDAVVTGLPAVCTPGRGAGGTLGSCSSEDLPTRDSPQGTNLLGGVAKAPSSLRHLCFTLAQLGQRGEWDGRWSPSGLGMRCSEEGKGLTRHTLPGLRGGLRG